MMIGDDAQGLWLACVVGMHVDVNQPGGDVEARYVNGLGGLGGGDFGRDLGDAVAADRQGPAARRCRWPGQ